MPYRLLAPAATAALLCLTTTAAIAQTSDRAPGPMNAERGWSAIGRCAQAESERARHTCVDNVLREAGLLTDEMHARQQRRAFGLDDKPVRSSPPAQSAPAATRPTNGVTASATSATAAPDSAASTARGSAATPAPGPTASTSPPPSAARSASTSASAPAPTAPPAQPDRLDVELAKVEKAVSGRIFVTTTDGAVWLQAESVEMPQPPVAGDRMSIRKGSMGGYRCSVASTHLTYRCTRSR